MATQEYTAAPEVAEVAKGVIERWHTDLAGADIRYAFADELPYDKQKRVLAKTKKASRWEQYLTQGAVLFVVVDAGAWAAMPPEKRIALIDHELCHVVGDGTGEIDTRTHDLEEFNEVISRHGAWTEDIEDFLRTAEEAQIKLPFVDAGGTGKVGEYSVTFTAADAEHLKRMANA